MIIDNGGNRMNEEERQKYLQYKLRERKERRNNGESTRM